MITHEEIYDQCMERFRGLEASDHAVAESLGVLKNQIKDLSGNGRPGRVDVLTNDVSKLKSSIASVIQTNKSQEKMIDSINDSINRIESRLWKIGMTLIGTTVLVQLLMKHANLL